MFLAMSSPIKRKPFNCESCITFWVTLVHYYPEMVAGGVYYPLLYALASAMAAKITFGLYLRYIGYLR